VGLLVVLAAARALVFSERLAVVELLVPGFLVVLRMRWLGRILAPAYRAALWSLPLAGIVGLFVFFGTFEYVRSWRFYRQDFDSYPQFILWRVTGYYTVAHNNGAMALATQPRYPLPYATLRSVWNIPGLAKTPLGYTRLTGIDPVARFQRMLERYGTPELNNEGGLFQPALDYGLAGYAVFWFGCGLVSGRLYRAYLVGSFAGIAFFPLIFIAVLETPRLLYLCYTRSLPPLVALLVIQWLAATAESYVAAPREAVATA
jgi:hypothetical protein